MPIVFMGEISRYVAEFQEPSLKKRFSQRIGALKNRFTNKSTPKKKRSLKDNVLGTTTAGRLTRVAGVAAGLAVGAKMLKKNKLPVAPKMNILPPSNTAVNMKPTPVTPPSPSPSSVAAPPVNQPVPSGTGFGKSVKPKAQRKRRTRK